jgi:hypothetical protein
MPIWCKGFGQPLPSSSRCRSAQGASARCR